MRHNATAMTWLQRGLLAVLGTTLVVAGLQATGNAVAKVNVADGTVWLASPPMGTMVQVSASSEQVLATVSVARQGDPLTAAQDGHSALVLNRSTGEVGRVDGATLRYGRQRTFASSSSDLQLLSGNGHAYVLDTGQGVVHNLDIGRPGAAKDTPLGSGPKEAQVDSKGNLWALDTEGKVTLVTAKGDSYTAKVAGRGASLTLADDKPYVVDPGTDKRDSAKVIALDLHNAKADRRYCLDGVDQSGLLATGTRTPNGRQLVMTLVPGSSQVVTSDLGSRKCTVLGVSDDVAGDQAHATSYGKPVASGDLLFVPVVSRGQVIVIDTAENRIVRTIDKTELFVRFTGQPFELLVDDGNVWFNNLGGPEASVLGRDGVLMRVLKYETSTPGAKGNGRVDAGIAATNDPSSLQVNVDPGKGTITTQRPGTSGGSNGVGGQGSGNNGDGKDGKGKGTGLNSAQSETQTATLTVLPPGAPPKDASGSSLAAPDVSITPGDNRVTGPGSAGIAPLPAGSAADLPPAARPAKLTANFAYSARVVEVGQTVAFQDTSTGSPPPNSWQWDFGDGSPVEKSQNVMHVFKTAGTYSMSLTVGNGLATDKTAPFQIEVLGPNQPPSANFTFDPPNPEVGSPVQFTDNSAGVVNDWSWSWGDGTVASGKVASKTFTTPNQYKVTLTVRNQYGSSSATKTVSVVDKVVPPKASFTFSPNKIAINDPVTFSDTSTGGPTTYRWDFGDGSGDLGNTKQWIHKFAKAGDFNVKLTVSNAKGTSEATQKVTVLTTTQPPRAAFTATASTAEVNQKITFTFTPSGPGDNGITPGTPTRYSWDFGDGTAPSTTPSVDHAWTTPGTYNVILTVANDAGTASSTPLSVKIDKAATKLVPAFSVRPGATAQDPARPNAAVEFRDLSGPTVTSWEWDFGDGARGSGAAVTHSYARAGTYTATLKVSDGSQTASTTNRVFVVGATTPPVADFTYSPAKAQVNATVAFADRSTGTPTAWKWDFGDGKNPSTEQNPSHVYSSAGTYNVTLTVSNAAGQTSPAKTVAVTVAAVALPPPKPDFSISPAQPYNAGRVLTFTDVTPNTPNPVSTPVFTFPTGTVTPQPGTRSAQYTFADPGNFPVTMKSCLVEDPANCAEITKSVTVQAAVDPPQASYVLSGAIVDQTTGIVDGEVVFTDTSKGNGITASTWVIGTRTFTGTQVRFTAASPGDVTVSHTVTNAAGSNEVKGVVHFVAKQLPTAQFSFGAAAVGTPVQFTDQSTGSPTKWRWDFGDGTTGTEQSPAHTFAKSGSFTVTLWASNQFGESPPVSKTVIVDPATPQPKIQVTSGLAAGAAANPVTVRQNTPVQLTDAGATADITAWDWNFGDGTPKGTGGSVTHTWAQTGTFTVVLTSTNSKGVTGTNSVTIRVI